MHCKGNNNSSFNATKESLRACQSDIFEVATEILEENQRLRKRIKELTTNCKRY